MSGTASKRAAHATLGARKRARSAPAKTAAAPSTAEEAPGPPAASSGATANAPLPLQLLFADGPTATSFQVEAVPPRSGDLLARTSAELLDAIDEVLGPATDDEAAPATGVCGQGAGSARVTETAANGDPPAQAPAQDTSSATSSDRGATARREPVTNWTVRNPGKVVPPTCNDYGMWTVVQLRKECAQRKFRLGRKVTKAEQIRQLRAYDAAQRVVQSSVDDENLLEARLRKTKHCVVRLLNILCSDEFIERLISSDDTATRDQIDAGEVNQRTTLWKEVGVQHRTNTIDYNHLFAAAANDPRFADIDPSHIVEHETAKLYDMWKKVYGNYAKAYAKFFDVAYLRVCVVEKPELEDFVRGGMYEQDEIDSLGLAALPPPPTKPSKWQDQVLKTVNRIADIFVKAPAAVAPPSTAETTPTLHEEDVLIDRIARLHQLIDQVKESQRKSEQSGAVDPTLARSISIYQQRLQHYESMLAKLY